MITLCTQHLKGEREKGKIDFLEPHADRADHEPQGRAHRQRKGEGGRDRHAGALHQQRERVGAEPVEHAVAERDHAAVADQKIQRGGEQRERRAADHEIDQRLARKDERQQGQHGERGGADHEVEGQRPAPHGQAISLPNRPVGLAISTITMNRYISPSVNRGKPRLPNDRMRPSASEATNAPTIEPMPPMTVTMKRLDQDGEAHARGQRAHRRGQRPGKSGQQPAEREHQAVEQAGIDAERGDHARIVRGRADGLAETRLVDDQPQRQADHERCADQEQIERRHHAAGDEQRRHLERRRHAHRLEFDPPDDLHHVVEDEDEAVADQKLHQHVLAVDAADEQALEHEADERGRRARAQDGQRVAAGELEDGQREIGAEHVEGAVGEIDDLQHAEDQRQPGGDQEQQHADDQAARRLGDNAGRGGEAVRERSKIHDRPRRPMISYRQRGCRRDPRRRPNIPAASLT